MIVIALFLNNPFVANIEILVIINAPFVIYVTFRYWIDKRLKWLKMTLSVAQGLYWHCPLSMRSGVYVMVGRLPVRLYVRQPHAAAAGLLLSGRRAVDIDPLLPGAQNQRCRRTALSSKCGQCHVNS